jgi:hypothetical protein
MLKASFAAPCKTAQVPTLLLNLERRRVIHGQRSWPGRSLRVAKESPPSPLTRLRRDSLREWEFACDMAGAKRRPSRSRLTCQAGEGWRRGWDSKLPTIKNQACFQKQAEIKTIDSREFVVAGIKLDYIGRTCYPRIHARRKSCTLSLACPRVSAPVEGSALDPMQLRRLGARVAGWQMGKEIIEYTRLECGRGNGPRMGSGPRNRRKGETDSDDQRGRVEVLGGCRSPTSCLSDDP